IAAIAADKREGEDVRMVAVEAMREMRNAGGIPTISKLVEDDQEAPALRRQAVLAMLHLDRNAALPLVRKMLATDLKEPDAIEFWRSLLGGTDVSQPLAEAIRQEPIPATAAAVGLRIARENANRHHDLVQILERISGIPAPKDYAPAEIQRIAVLAKLRGNPERGELVYR